jgi:hypothetical protein
VTGDKSDATVGDPVQLSCATGDQHGVNVTWLRDNQPVDLAANEKRYQLSGTNLVITKLNKKEAGQYSCQIKTERGEQITSDSFKLSVQLVPVPNNCVDKPWYANCALITEGQFCRHPYFSVFCCKSCYMDGQLP